MHSVVNMFWAGPRMGALHAACLRSFMRHGYKVVLHCYDRPPDAPKGVETFDAARLLPPDQLLANRRTGSVALGANRYRYLMTEAGMGLYADCDMFCMSGPRDDGDHVIGREDDETANTAILHYPPGGALSRDLLAATADKYAIPDGLKPLKRLRLEARRVLGAPRSVEDGPWGVWGPTLMTRLLRRHGLWDRTSPSDMFYPVHPRNVSLLREPGLRLADLATPRTRFVHLWHKLLGDAPAPPNSPLEEILSA